MPLFKSAQEKQLERDIQMKHNRKRIERHVEKQRKSIVKYWELAKRAVRLKDDQTFERIAAFILSTQQDIVRWERALLNFDVMLASKEAALAVKELADAYQAMSQSIIKNSDPREMARIQRDVQLAQGRVEAMDMMMEEFMSISEGMLDEVASSDTAGELKQIMQAVRTEAEQEEQGAGVASDEIAASLKAVEELLKRG